MRDKKEVELSRRFFKCVRLFLHYYEEMQKSLRRSKHYLNSDQKELASVNSQMHVNKGKLEILNRCIRSAKNFPCSYTDFNPAILSVFSDGLCTMYNDYYKYMVSHYDTDATTLKLEVTVTRDNIKAIVKYLKDLADTIGSGPDFGMIKSYETVTRNEDVVWSVEEVSE